MQYAGQGKHFADLFCGPGTFTRPLAEKGKVTAIDSAVDAVQALARAATGHAIQTQTRNLFTDPLTEKELNSFECVVLDPPRAGAKEQCAVLARSNVRRIVYVSCNAQTFSRDVAMLQAGGYQVKEIQPVDQFTWSAHGELVSLIERD